MNNVGVIQFNQNNAQPLTCITYIIFNSPGLPV